jgi:NAD(P)H-dependent FMN reductase
MVLRVVTIPGSLRAASYNRKLLKVAEQFLEQEVELDRIDLKDFPLPPYDGDIQDQRGIPAEAEALKDRVRAAHGVLVSAPEYNWGVSGMYKNVFDWMSRGRNQPWAGKVVGIIGATDGPFGTWRATPMYRQMYASVGAIVLPQSVNLPNAQNVWDESGKLVDEKLPERVQKFVGQFMELLRRMQPVS